MNLFDYLTWRSDVPLSVSPFNPVDSLILSELAYTDFEGVLPFDGAAVPLSEACEAYFSVHSREEVKARPGYTAPAPFLMDFLLRGARFRETALCFFESLTDYDDPTQFAALTCLLPDGTAFVSFRGTDGTVLGWKEDLILSYRSRTKGQLLAAEYLDRAAAATDRPLLIGGHSKGGNLAIYAAAFCSPETQNRIRQVYSNDGPGFRDELRGEASYLAVMPKCLSIIPDTSVIGLLLTNDCPRIVVESSAAGMVQHDGFTWQTGPTGFLPAELSRRGEYAEKTISAWVSRQDDETLRSMVDSLFQVLEAPGADSFHVLKSKKIRTAELMMAAARGLPKEKQKEFLSSMGQLLQSSGVQLLDIVRPDGDKPQT